MIVIERVVCYPWFPRGGGTACLRPMQGHTEEYQGGVGGGDVGRKLSLGFRGKEQVRQGKQAEDWLV